VVGVDQSVIRSVIGVFFAATAINPQMLSTLFQFIVDGSN
jgi:hypothetical protein